jgi:hypothetical protein
MRTQSARIAVLAAMLVALAVSGSASATTTGITIEEPQLVAQRGTMRFTAFGVEVPILCSVVLAKTLITEVLIPVTPELVKLGKVRAGRFIECNYQTQFLNLPMQLGEGVPGPLEESWDITFLSSNLLEGQLRFGILDFQVRILLPGGIPCLYRGTLLGTLGPNGRVLTYSSTIPLSAGFMCPEEIRTEGSFTNEPPIRYTLLVD